MISWLALDDREMVIIKIGRGEHLHFNRKRPKTSTLGRLGINGLKKFSGKFESFVHKLIKKTTIPWFFDTNILKYFSSREVPVIRHKGHSHSGPKILHFDTSLQPFVTTTSDFDHSSLWPVISTIRRNGKSLSVFGFFCRSDRLSKWRIKVTDGRRHVSKWPMVEVTCRSEGFWGLRGSSTCV